jgi:RNA polymerase sigma factor (TIGR02999 family)
MPLVYAELRRQATRYVRRERVDHTLQPTALVNEAYLHLVGQRRVVWQDRAHFFGIAAQMMRRILVDYARGRGARSAVVTPSEWSWTTGLARRNRTTASCCSST